MTTSDSDYNQASKIDMRVSPRCANSRGRGSTGGKPAMRNKDMWRVCSKCDGPLEAVYANSHWRVCKACRAKAMQLRYAADPIAARERNNAQRAANLELANVRASRYRSTHRAELNTRAADYYWRDAEQGRQRLRERRKTERFQVWTRKWNAAHPWRIWAYWLADRARRAGAEGSVSERDLRRMFARFGGMCAYCHNRQARTVDHVIPFARGGRHTIGNLLPACAACNGSKHARTIVEWRNDRTAHRSG